MTSQGIAQPIAGRPRGPAVLVLGATGMIGRALIGRLLQDGQRLRALVRRRSDRSAALAQQGVEVVLGDIADRAALEAALQGIEHVYHLVRGAGPSWDDYLQCDIAPTRRLAELCSARGIGLVYTSSIAIYDGGRAGDTISEATPASGASMRLNAYARAKVANERLLVDMHRERGLNVVVFRPGIVIGRGGDPRHAGVGAWPDAVTCRPWGGGRHRLPFVLADDCAAAMARVLQVPGIAGESFNLVGDASLTGNEYLDALERIAGRKIARRPLPAWRLFAQSVVKWGFKVLIRDPERALPSYRYCDGLSCRATYVADRAKQRLGWAPVADPRVLIERGLVAALAESGPRPAG